jgi:hypothetical protein
MKITKAIKNTVLDLLDDKEKHSLRFLQQATGYKPKTLLAIRQQLLSEHLIEELWEGGCKFVRRRNDQERQQRIAEERFLEFRVRHRTDAEIRQIQRDLGWSDQVLSSVSAKLLRMGLIQRRTESPLGKPTQEDREA